MSSENQTVLGVVQFTCSDDPQENIATAERLVRQAAAQGANIVLVQELFSGLYFCLEENPVHFARAHTLEEDPAVGAMRALARELGVVIPVSFFERRNQAFYNSLAMVDDQGAIMGLYRKSHIPDGPGYSEKFYFHPGDTGFKVWQTRFGKIGCGICWDQWFPEAARAMVLQGAEFLLYPTAIGSEPSQPDIDSSKQWRTAQQGHAASNMVPVAAANRTGTQTLSGVTQSFYGNSFIAGPDGQIVASADRDGEAVLVARFDRKVMADQRAFWGLFRDRRTDLYDVLATADGGMS
ncbi:MAG: N-carbamoylputrescine amidase [Rhizobiaceae bacterium]